MFQRVSARVQGGGMMRFTPPPAHLARPEVLKGVCDRAKMVADALGLNGVAQLDAFMHADSADLVLVNAHAIPDMSSASDIFQQWENTAVVHVREVISCLMLVMVQRISAVAESFMGLRRRPNLDCICETHMCEGHCAPTLQRRHPFLNLSSAVQYR